jgi:hypothetical protein
MRVQTSFAQDLNLGLAYSPMFIKDQDTNEIIQNKGLGLTSSYENKFGTFYYGISSDLLFGKLASSTIQINELKISGNGSFRIFSIAPYLKYQYEDFLIINNWNLYFIIAPKFSMNTYVFNQELINNQSTKNKRMATLNKGAMFGIGLQEVKDKKIDNPKFVEFSYTIQNSYRATILDASDFKEVTPILETKTKRFSGQYMVLKFGMTLF